MDVYVYQAALYCEDCGDAIAEELRASGVEDSGDSDGFPQGPYGDGGGEADVPQHCDSGEQCLNAEILGDRRVGALLENPLTTDGQRYVAQKVAESPGNEVVQRWTEFYASGRIDVGRFPEFEETHIETWFERDRAHLALYDSRTSAILAEWWDDDLREAIEDGFLQPKRYQRSAYEYAAERARESTELGGKDENEN